MSPIEDFDAHLFADELRSLYFQRSRAEAIEKEDILIAQIESIVRSAEIDSEAYEQLTGAPGWIRLEKLLQASSGASNMTLAIILELAADRIEYLEAELRPRPVAAMA